jgi:hypothetical protein
MNKDVFLAIANRIAAVVPSLKWIDWDSGQLDFVNNNERPAIAFPACLIELEYPLCEEIGGGEQIVTCNVTLRLVFYPKGETSHVSPVRESSLTVFNTLTAVHSALQGWSSEALSIFSRLNSKSERRKDGLKVYRVIYQTAFTETVDPVES